MTDTILQVNERVHDSLISATATLTLNFDLRQKSRLRTTLDNGKEILLNLPRGSVLRDGEYLRAQDGSLIQVKAAAEPVSTAYSDDNLLLARACYHLGNRHIPLQISARWLRYQHDAVLDNMVQALGLIVRSEQAIFEPESGAYHQPHT